MTAAAPAQVEPSPESAPVQAHAQDSRASISTALSLGDQARLVECLAETNRSRLADGEDPLTPEDLVREIVKDGLLELYRSLFGR